MTSAPARCPCWDDPNPPPGARCRRCRRIVPGKFVHTCHARECRTPVRPTLLMCPSHWRLVPASIRRAVYAAYRRGQCDDKRPSAAWHEAASAAIGYVALQCGLGILSMNEVKALRAHGYATQSDDKGRLVAVPVARREPS